MQVKFPHLHLGVNQHFRRYRCPKTSANTTNTLCPELPPDVSLKT